MKDGMEFLRSVNAVVEDHFVFKAGHKHGNIYINKEQFIELGALNLIKLINQVVKNAVNQGLSFSALNREVGVIGPAYGAIPFALTVAGALEEYFPHIKFFPARTQLKKVEGRDVHYIPDKLLGKYRGKIFIGIEDIVNNGTTCREVKQVFRTQANADVVAFLCFVNRADETAESLGLQGFYPLMDPKLEQYDLLTSHCPKCAKGEPINTELGKGKEWVSIFGQPPYLENMDFSKFWEKD